MRNFLLLNDFNKVNYENKINLFGKSLFHFLLFTQGLNKKVILQAIINNIDGDSIHFDGINVVTKV